MLTMSCGIVVFYCKKKNRLCLVYFKHVIDCYGNRMFVSVMWFDQRCSFVLNNIWSKHAMGSVSENASVPASVPAFI